MSTLGFGVLSRRVDRVYLDGALGAAATGIAESFAFAVVSTSASVTGVAAAIYVVSRAGVPSGTAQGAGFGVLSRQTDRIYLDGALGMAVTSAGQWFAFPVTMSAVVTGVTAASAAAAPPGSSSAGAAVAGITAAITLMPGSGTLRASAAVSGIAAAIGIGSPVGSVAASVRASGTAGAITSAGRAGTLSGTGRITGVTAAISVAAPSGTASGATGGTFTEGIAAAITVSAPPGTLAAGAATIGVTAAVFAAAPSGSSGAPESPVDYTVAVQNMIRQGYSDADILAYLYQSQNLSVPQQVARLAPAAAAPHDESEKDLIVSQGSGYWY